MVFSKFGHFLLQSTIKRTSVSKSSCLRCFSTLPSNWEQEFVSKLTAEQRKHLMNALKTIESEEIKADLRGQLAAYRWRSKLGRPSKIAEFSDVDATGSYCPLPDDAYFFFPRRMRHNEEYAW